MLSFIIFLFVFATLFDNRNETRKILYSVIWFFAVIWSIRMLAYIGFSLLPCIIVIMVMGRVVIPFLRGFFSRF